MGIEEFYNRYVPRGCPVCKSHDITNFWADENTYIKSVCDEGHQFVMVPEPNFDD